MSLKEAVLDIVKEMEQPCDPGVSIFLRTYALALKAACKAAGDTPVAKPVQIDPQTQHRLEIDKARAEFRTKPAKEEEASTKFVMVALTGDMVEMPGDMPVGAKTMLGKTVFELRDDGKLHEVKVSDGQEW